MPTNDLIRSTRFLETAGVEPVRQWNGVYAAKVTNNQDPLKMQRVRMLVPQVLGGAESNWAEPLGYTGGYAPAVGSMIHAMFLGGDPRYPVYQGIAQPPNITSGNFFMYNTSFAQQGTLVAAFTPMGVGTDSVGNAYPTGFNFGFWNPSGLLKQHFGIDNNGNTYIVDTSGVTRVLTTNGTAGPTGSPAILFYNAFGAVIQVVDPSRGGNFQYLDNNSAVQGGLIGAQVGKNAIDPINSTAVNAGITIIDPAFGDYLQILGNSIHYGLPTFTVNAFDTANAGSTNQGPFRHIAGPEQGQAGHVVQRWYGKSPDGTRGAGTVISLTDPPTRNTANVLEVQGTASFSGAVTFAGITCSTLVVTSSNSLGGLLQVTDTFASGVTFPVFTCSSQTAGDPMFGFNIASDSFFRFQSDTNGTLSWGPGGGSGFTMTLTLTASGQLSLNTTTGLVTGPTFEIRDVSGTPSAPSAGSKLLSSSGQLKYVSEDGNTYNTGRFSVYTTGTQGISSTTPTSVTGLSIPVVAGKYRWRAIISFRQNASNSAYLYVSGPTTSTFHSFTSYGIDGGAFQSSIGVNTNMQSFALTSENGANGAHFGQIEGFATFTASGNLVVSAAASANVLTFTIQTGSILEVYPDA